ncbi:MAG: Nif3-like dinuclear metal center hexameric protein [Bacteroidetes bacterium]|nr:Nif3-like dinuclear metal center hexameric protein [Bacteroidota bacterium]MCL1968296.1 Nif3-like dinuclear metal center hexameric protein [Bacteroidota bacterium]
MQIKEVIQFLEQKFPLQWQEDFDNCGVQCGDASHKITGIVVCFDMSEAVIDEAIAKGANMVISHHPIIYKNGLRKIEPNNRVGKIIIKALENRILLYSMHTNIDSGKGGGNVLFAQKLGLQKLSVLSPKEHLFYKLVVFIPAENSVLLKEALFRIGCGNIGNYSHCSYSCEGVGSFKPLAGANPHIGKHNRIERVDEERVEMIFPKNKKHQVIETLYQNHPYEEPAFDIIALENQHREVGLGRMGLLPKPMLAKDFILYVKEKLNLDIVKYSGNIEAEIKKVAVCGGGGASFITDALIAEADAFITGDLKYHDFFIPENKMLLIDIGHFEGEHFIREIIVSLLQENFNTFATHFTEVEIPVINKA